MLLWKNKPAEENTFSHSKSNRETGVKLPKLVIKVFNGDATEWKPFIDSFEAAVHTKENLSSVEKFTYLKGYLSGTALQAIEGFPLTSENYTEALKLLNNRYGNPQLVISSHMNNLIKLDKVSGANVKELRHLYDKIESNVRALNSVGINSDYFDPLLIPIILEKLPNVIRLQISRKLGREDWDVNAFLKCICEEISARESYEFLKQQETENDESCRRKTTHSLVVNQNNRTCVFCKSNNHYSDRCDVITDVEARLTHLKKNRCCFNCLKVGHSKKNCRFDIECYKCQTTGNHCTALCMKEKRDASSFVVSDNQTVLLQTAVAYAANEKEANLQQVKIVLDSCSQQTYITENVVKKLKLQPLREVKTLVKPFGSTKGKIMSLKEYKVCLKPRNKSSSNYVNALAVPNICAPINGQNIPLAKE